MATTQVWKPSSLHDPVGRLTREGTEQPAHDCILRGEDVAKYRGGVTFKNEIEQADSKQEATADIR
jgi:hypothetical protein